MRGLRGSCYLIVLVLCSAHKLGKARRHHQTWQQQQKKFWVSLDRVCYELGVVNIYNADQSGTCFEYLPKLTINGKGVKNLWVEKTSSNHRHVSGRLGRRPISPFCVLKIPLPKNSDTAKRNATGRHVFGICLWKDIKVLSQSSVAPIYGKRE